MAVGTAFRAFWKCLWDPQFSGDVAERIKAGPTAKIAAASEPSAPAAAPAEKLSPAKPEKKEKAPPPAGRSEALTLLATLQREGRLIDFLKEPLADYSAEQIRGVVLDVHRDCGAVLERLFAVRPATEQAEGETIELPAGYDAGKFRLLGEANPTGPQRATIVHPGWQATRCEVPVWTGAAPSALILAPVEVEAG